MRTSERPGIWSRTALTTAIAALIGHIPPAKGEPDDRYESLNDSWDRFGSVYARVIEHYYDPVDHDAIMRAAIEGMLRQLDPYTQYFDEEGLRQLRQDTTGRFAGLGITVGIKDQIPVVIAPIEGTPADRAGLLPGDMIVAIEGRETFGRSLEQVVTDLRGEPGTSVRITVDRRGVLENWDVVIVREMIQIRSVAVAEEIVPGIGYISMRQTRFSEETSAEMEAALERIFALEVKGLILDLRGNPGGLLSQAAEVADLFLPRGAPIVSVRERSGRREETKRSERRPPSPHLPLVVLIDGGSASAAEIVAGAVQDNDRGLVVGTTSFGKGSVQTVFDLRDDDRAALKLTTALYFTPSGRSIHRESLALPGLLQQVPFGDVSLPGGQLLSVVLSSPDVDVAGDRLRARFDLDERLSGQILQTTLGDLAGRGTPRSDIASADSASFRTNGGRPVYGSGGIEPDLVVEGVISPAYVQELRRHRVFFDFVVDYVGRTGEGGDPPPPEVDDAMMAAFREYLPGSAAGVARDRRLHQAFGGLRRLADESGWDGAVRAGIDSLESAVRRQEGGDPLLADLVEGYLRSELRRELALRVEGRKASLIVALQDDPQVKAAVTLLRDPTEYDRVLSGGTE